MITFPPLFFEVTFGICGLSFLFCCSLYFWRHDKFPIRHRLPEIVAVELTCLGVSIGLFCFENVLPTSCKTAAIIFSVNAHITIITMFYRVGWLFIKEVSTKLLVAEGGNKGPQNLNLVNRCTYAMLKFEWKFVSRKTCLILHASPLLILAALDLWKLISLPTNDYSPADPRCSMMLFQMNEIKLSSLVYDLPHFMMVAGTLYSMDDNFKIAFEIRVIFVWVVVFLIQAEVLVFLGEVQVLKFLSTTVFLVFVMALTVYPIFLSFQQEKAQKNEKSLHATVQDEFIQALKNPNMRNLFYKFLASEFSLENLLFYEACIALERSVESNTPYEAVLKQVIYIRDQYISKNATASVNLSFKVRQDAMSGLENLEQKSADHLPDLLEILAPAKKEILILMLRDSFLRFRTTPQYNQEKNAPSMEMSDLTKMSSILRLLSTGIDAPLLNKNLNQ
jgi:hypothetical protein